MNKEVEEAIETLKEFIEINQAITCESLTNEDRINSLRCKAELTILNYIKDSTSNSAIREKVKELNKQYDEITSKYTEDELDNGKEEYDDLLKMDRISEKLNILREILKEGEK